MKKILVVDDEALYAMLLKRALSDEGYAVETASRGDEAVHVGKRFGPDVLLTDWMLKDDLTGLEVARRLRDHNPQLQVLLVTGMADTQLRDAARRAGVFRTLDKPCSLEDMLDAVTDALRVTEPSPP